VLKYKFEKRISLKYNFHLKKKIPFFFQKKGQKTVPKVFFLGPTVFFLASSVKSYSQLVQQNSKQYNRSVVIKGTDLNGHTSGFDPQTQKYEPPCATNNTSEKYCSITFI